MRAALLGWGMSNDDGHVAALPPEEEDEKKDGEEEEELVGLDDLNWSTIYSRLGDELEQRHNDEDLDFSGDDLRPSTWGDSSPQDEELLSLRKSVVTGVVVHQQRRICELERQVAYTRRRIDALRRENQLNAEQLRGCESTATLSFAAADAEADRLISAEIAAAGAASAPEETVGSACFSAGACADDIDADASRGTGGESVDGEPWAAAATAAAAPDAAHSGSSGAANANSANSTHAAQSAGSDGAFKQTRYWTPTEHQRFLQAVSLYGIKNYAAISAEVGSRTAKQVRTHAQKYQKRVERERAAAETVALSPPSGMFRHLRADASAAGGGGVLPPGVSALDLSAAGRVRSAAASAAAHVWPQRVPNAGGPPGAPWNAAGGAAALPSEQLWPAFRARQAAVPPPPPTTVAAAPTRVARGSSSSSTLASVAGAAALSAPPRSRRRPTPSKISTSRSSTASTGDVRSTPSKEDSRVDNVPTGSWDATAGNPAGSAGAGGAVEGASLIRAAEKLTTTDTCQSESGVVTARRPE